MSVGETILVYVVYPGAIIAVLGIGSFGSSLFRRGGRYRPGRSWDFAPVWYVPHPGAIEHGVPAQVGKGKAVGGASGEW